MGTRQESLAEAEAQPTQGAEVSTRATPDNWGPLERLPRAELEVSAPRAAQAVTSLVPAVLAAVQVGRTRAGAQAPVELEVVERAGAPEPVELAAPEGALPVRTRRRSTVTAPWTRNASPCCTRSTVVVPRHGLASESRPTLISPLSRVSVTRPIPPAAALRGRPSPMMAPSFLSEPRRVLSAF